MSTSSSTPSSPLLDPPGSVPPSDMGSMVKVSQRASKSCTECSQRKTKCDKTIPCNNCVKRGRSHLCCVPVHVKKPTAKSMKRRASPDRDSSTPLPTPHTSTNLPLPLPLPPPPPAPVDPTILQPLYAEIDRLRGVVDTLQSRLHWFEGVVAFAMAQPHSQPTDQAQAQAQPREDTSSAHEPPSMLTPIPSPPSAAGYSFYPPRSPAFPPHNLPYCPLPAPPSAPSAPLASTPYPPERQDVAYSHPSSGLQLTSLSVPPPQFPLPTPTIPRAQLGDDAMEHERERKRLRVEGEEAHGRSEEGRREGERIGDGTTMMSRRGSSSLNKLLSTTEGVDGLAR